MNTKKRRKRKAAPGNPKRAVCYRRISTDNQDLSPEVQREMISKWADDHEVELVADHLDRGVSGGSEIEARAGLVAALYDLARYKAGVLIVAKRDRLARDVGVAALVEREVRRNGAQVLSADGQGNGNDAQSALMRGMADLFASHERELIKERTRAALSAKKAKGERVGSVPLGKQLAEDGVHLLDHAEEMETMEMAHELHLDGMSYREIARELDAEGRPTREGRPWEAKQVWRLVQQQRRALVRLEQRDAGREPTAQDRREFLAALKAAGVSVRLEAIRRATGYSLTLLRRTAEQLERDGRIIAEREGCGAPVIRVALPN